MMWKIYDQSEKLSFVDHMFVPKMIELPETFCKIKHTIIFRPRPMVEIIIIIYLGITPYVDNFYLSSVFVG